MDNVQIVLRLLLSAFLSGLIGFELQPRRPAAGLRAQVLVAIGSSNGSIIEGG